MLGYYEEWKKTNIYMHVYRKCEDCGGVEENEIIIIIIRKEKPKIKHFHHPIVLSHLHSRSLFVITPSAIAFDFFSVIFLWALFNHKHNNIYPSIQFSHSSPFLMHGNIKRIFFLLSLSLFSNNTNKSCFSFILSVCALYLFSHAMLSKYLNHISGEYCHYVVSIWRGNNLPKDISILSVIKYYLNIQKR